MKRYIVLFAALFVLPQLNIAQTLSNAFLISNNRIQGTARSEAMGNAFGALGGDFTSLSINPAGSAIYQSGEFVFTPGYYYNKSKLTLDGNSFSDNDQSISLNNLGYIGTSKVSGSESGIVSISYGFGYNRLANFDHNAFANFSNSSVSWLDDIVSYANSEALSNSYLEQTIGDVEYRDWNAKLAWDTYLIDPATDDEGAEIDGQYVNILYDGETVNQYKTFQEEGHLDEYLFNIGLNFNYKFYLGATLGYQNLWYKKYSIYEEDFSSDNSWFEYGDKLILDGYGLNVKIGAIYKPSQNVRLGLAIHTPTFYNIDDESTLAMNSYLADNYSQYGVNRYDYDFNSPMKVILSGAVIFNKVGLLSVDAEYQNYEAMRFRRGGDGDTFNDLNSSMADVFNNVVNLRIGGEYRLTNQFSLRAGYAYYGNPFDSALEEQVSLSDDTSVISCGFGYSVNAFSLNVAYSNAMSSIYEGGVQANYYQVARENNDSNLLVSFGFRF